MIDNREDLVKKIADIISNEIPNEEYLTTSDLRRASERILEEIEPLIKDTWAKFENNSVAFLEFTDWLEKEAKSNIIGDYQGALNNANDQLWKIKEKWGVNYA